MEFSRKNLKYAYDSILTVNDKLSKAIILVPGREDWSAQEWAEAYYHHVWRRWALPQAIIYDRGGQFLSDFWRTLFEAAKTRLLLTMSYHPQGDGQSDMVDNHSVQE